MTRTTRKLLDFLGCALTLGKHPRDQWQILWRQTKNLRVQLGLSRFHPQEIYRLDTHFGKLSFRDNFGDITNLTNLLYRQVYRWKDLKHPGSILDVGANIGLASVWFAHFNPDRRVICFEPLPENAAMIRLNCPQAEVVNMAVGGSVSSVTLTTDADGVMASHVPNPHNSYSRTFPVVTLDTMAQEKGIGQVGLLKIDAEGMEVEILQGAPKLLCSTGQIVIETHGMDNHTTCLARLLQAGFQIEDACFGESTGMIFAVCSKDS